jgi:hypothetical protein
MKLQRMAKAKVLLIPRSYLLEITNDSRTGGWHPFHPHPFHPHPYHPGTRSTGHGPCHQARSKLRYACAMRKPRATVIMSMVSVAVVATSTTSSVVGQPANKPSKPTGPAPSVRAVAPSLGPVNLLQQTSTRIAVSSTVDNPTNRPDHLRDGVLGTAWNSRTGDLKGAWIAIRLAPGAAAQELKITAGYDDPKHPDYFAANHRITKLRLWRDGVNVLEAELQPEQRGLQTVRLPASAAVANSKEVEWKIEIVDVLPGSKKAWREICVSELELWGIAAGKPSPTFQPPILVGGFDVVRASIVNVHASKAAMCDEVLEPHAESTCTDDQGCDDVEGPPACAEGMPADNDSLVALGAPRGPWREATIYSYRNDSIYGAFTCALQINVGKKWYAVPFAACTGEPSDGGLDALAVVVDELAVRNVVAGKQPELVLRWTTTERDSHAVTKEWMLCGIGPSRTVSCGFGKGTQPNAKTYFP